MSGWLETLQSWVASFLFRLGFLNKEASIVVVGLDNAGKTTLLHKLMTGRVSIFSPTDRAHEERFDLGGVHFRAWDLGGHEPVRLLWQDFVPGSQGVVFVVDGAAEDRLEEAADELHELLSIPAMSEFRVPVAVLLNKADLPAALPDAALVARLGLVPGCLREGVLWTGAAEGGEQQPAVLVRCFRSSVLRDLGYEDGLRWIADSIPP